MDVDETSERKTQMDTKRKAAFQELEINIPQCITSEGLAESVDHVYDGLSELFQGSRDLLNLGNVARKLLDNGAVVNSVDCHGNAPLYLLALHVNRGLSYTDSLVTIFAERQKNHNTGIVDVHEKYQRQVFRCLEMLLDCGADASVVPKTCPSVIHQTEWNELFELKLVQSKSRWFHLRTGISMESNKHSAFDPLLSKREENCRRIRIVHLLAWRGDVHCMELLLRRCSIDADVCTADGWNALHFLYFYCLKPSDLVAATKLLVDSGANVNQSGRGGVTPIHLLLRHVIVKRSHVKYLASAHRHDYLRSDDVPDNYCDEVRQCLELLVAAGATVTGDFASGTPLHVIFERFRQSLVNCDWQFQVMDHDVVPYDFQLKPVVEFVSYFVRLPDFDVNATNEFGQTVLHVLASSLRNLCFDESLNPTEVLSRTFSILLSAGANPNALDRNQLTVGHILIELATSDRGAFNRYNPIILALIHFGANFDHVDRSGNSMLHFAIKKGLVKRERLMVLMLLLRCGADPSVANGSLLTPLDLLLAEHSEYKTCQSPIFLQEIIFICRTMTLSSFNHVASRYLTEGFYGVTCPPTCPVTEIVSCHYRQPRPLRDVCRQTVRRSMGRRFLLHCQTDLPLPKTLTDFLFELIS